jgi:hypothetical protein
MTLQKYVCGTNFEFKHIESERKSKVENLKS